MNFIATYSVDANVLMSYVTHRVDSRKRGERGLVIFKIGLEKAYDHAAWNFVDYMLGRFGFSAKWRGG